MLSTSDTPFWRDRRFPSQDLAYWAGVADIGSHVPWAGHIVMFDDGSGGNFRDDID